MIVIRKESVGMFMTRHHKSSSDALQEWFNTVEEMLKIRLSSCRHVSLHTTHENIEKSYRILRHFITTLQIGTQNYHHVVTIFCIQ
jgi:hypothetical protein